MEQIEGSAAYVAMSLLFCDSLTAAQKQVRDSLQVHLTRVSDARQLGRNYSFWVGAAWMALAAAEDVAGWQELVEQGGLDELTRRVVNASSAKPASADNSESFLKPLDSLRQLSDRLLSRALNSRDSAARAFDATDGIVIQIRWTPRDKTRSHTRTGRAGLETEYSVRFGDGLDSLSADGMFQHTCCPSMLRAKAKASDVHLEVAGHVVSVGKGISPVTGAVTLRTPHLTLAYHVAKVAVGSDSILIQLDPPLVREE